MLSMTRGAAVRGCVMLATCGVMTMRGCAQKACSGGGGCCSRTSITAAEIWPLSSAARRSGSTRWAPRPTCTSPAPRGSRAKGAGVEDAAGLSCQRQEADKDVEVGEEGAKPVRPVPAIDAGDPLCRAAPAGAAEAELAEPLEHGRAQHAEA